MNLKPRIFPDETGAAAIEMAFALPILVVMLWAFVQLAQVYRATAGIQQALGEGARFATVCQTPTVTGCATPVLGTGNTPADGSIKKKVKDSVAGIGPGTFTVDDPTSGNAGTARFIQLRVQYSQPTNLLMFPGPTMTVSRSKRVWIATSA